MWMRRCVVAGVLVLAPGAVRADFTYQEKTQITGGALVGMMKLAGTFSKQARQAGEPIVATVYLKGNRMTRVTQDRTEMINLDKETITTIDNAKRQYTVLTFEQMKQQIDAAVAKAKQEQAKTPAASSTAPATTDVKFLVAVRQTGTGKEVEGVQTNEAILAMTMDATDKKSGQTGSLAITNDMWLAPAVPGYGEVGEFYKRYAVKMGRVMGGAMNAQVLAMQPGLGQGMVDMAKEMSKLQGIPVLQVMRVGTTLNGQPLPAASEAPLPATDTPAMPTVGNVAQQTAASVIASKLGGLGSLSGIGSGLGGFGRKKKADAAAAANSTLDSTADAASNAAAAKATGTGQAGSGQAGSAAANSAVLMESKTEMTGFSQGSVDASRFTVPAGYAKVEARSME